MRVALCLSGHLRSFERTWQSLRKFIIDPLQADVFIHTWNTLGVYNHIDSHTVACDTNKYLNKIKYCYNPKNIVIEPINKTRGRKYQPYLVDKRNCVGVTNMFYKIHKADELMRNYSNYDLVIRARPDLAFHCEINNDHIQQSIEEKSIFLPDFGHFTGFNDQFAFGSSDSMKVYANCYLELDTWATQVPFLPETLLKHHLIKNNMLIKFTNIQYYLLRVNGLIFDNKFHSPGTPNI